jgi:transposase
MSAIQLFGKNLNNSEISRRLKVSNQTVSRWRKQYRQSGEAALRKAGRAGRKGLLDEEQRSGLVERLLKGPEQLGYETPLWTCARVSHLIEEAFGIRYHPGHVWRILRELNWSPQRPVGKALERDEIAIEDWKKKTWPELKKKPKKRTGRSSSSTRAG